MRKRTMPVKQVRQVKQKKNRRKIETVKKELYERIRAQISDRLGLEDREIKKSERSFKSFFSRSWTKSSASQLRKQIEMADIIFWGDFHGVRQFQNNLLRWLKRPDMESRPLVLALECLPSSCQKWVDQYLTGFISEEEFLERVRWERVWGFPWSHYKPLFDWARENKRILKMINGPKAGSPSKIREKWGLRLIKDLYRENPQAQIFVLYGEYHLLPKGFPALVKKEKDWTPLFIFQNSDSLYFRKMRQPNTAEETIFKMSPFYYCVQNVLPWVKWQNYNLFLEASQDTDFEEELDLTEHVLSLSQVLSKTLEMPLDPNHYAVFTSGDRALWDHLKKLPENEFIIFEDLIRENMSFIYPPGDWAFLGRISANETAGLAMQVLLFQFNKEFGWKIKSGDHWEFLIWIQAFSYFGSKLINPHRKSPSLLDLQKKSRGFSNRPVERQAARLAVNYTLHQSLFVGNALGEISLSHAVRFQAAKWISGLLGELLYNAYNQGRLNLETLKAFLRKDPQGKNFQVVIHNLFEVLS